MVRLLVILVVLVAVAAAIIYAPPYFTTTKQVRVPGAADVARRSLIVDVYRLASAQPLPLIAERRPGETHSLSTLFATAGVDLRIGSEQILPDPAQRTLYTGRELDKLRASIVGNRTPGWRVAVIVLPSHVETRLAGWTFPERRDTVFVFTDAVDTPALRMRSAAHELGHALNLFHGDADGGRACCRNEADAVEDGVTLMAQTRCLSTEQWSFSLSRAEVDHLRNHPEEFVKPGSAWGTCTKRHVDACTL